MLRTPAPACKGFGGGDLYATEEVWEVGAEHSRANLPEYRPPALIDLESGEYFDLPSEYAGVPMIIDERSTGESIGGLHER